MTDRLVELLREEADRLEVPPPPTDAILGGARRLRRARQASSVLAVAAAVAVVAAGLVGIRHLVADAGPEPSSPPTPSSTVDAPPAGQLEVSGAGIGRQRFGTDAGAVLARVTARLGDPDRTVGPRRFFHQPGGGDAWFESADDPFSPSWRYPAESESCWRTLCLVFGGEGTGTLRLRGWALTTQRPWAAPRHGGRAQPDVRLAGSGIRLGDPWTKLHTAYPETVVAGGEGASVIVRNTPWPVPDGVLGWRLSGAWDHTHQDRAPDGAVVTRLTGGEAPQPGCC